MVPFYIFAFIAAHAIRCVAKARGAIIQQERVGKDLGIDLTAKPARLTPAAAARWIKGTARNTKVIKLHLKRSRRMGLQHSSHTAGRL